jgi:pimeloyl-ACP methyl ester carboxylesterase
MKTTNPAELTSASSAVITTGSVTSRDGTRIGYLRLGQGPAAVLLHGSKESARSHLQLALALADAFTLYLPDRRGRGMSGPHGAGRGMSGPHGAGHGARAEVDDLAAVVAESGAQMVFAVSISAMIALEAARTRPAIRKVAAYEPALLMDRTAYTGWLSRFDQEMAEGRVDAALITSIRGFDLAPPMFRLMPRRLLEALTSKAMESEDKRAASGAVTMRKLAPTLHYEGVLLAEMAGTLGNFAELPAEVLLLGGDMKRPAFIRPAFEALARTLPRCQRAEFPGLDHGGSSDISSANRNGEPEVVAPAIRSFFQQ